MAAVTRRPSVRPVAPDDVPAVVALVHELADYERLPQDCHLTVDALQAALFPTGPDARPAVYCLVVDDDGAIIGYALYFLSFSTWEGVHGIYLEDLYVSPASRGSGSGRALLTELARIAVARGYARVEWSVLDWNAPAIEFYRRLGARPMDGWSVYRLTGPDLVERAGEAAGHAPG